MAMRIARVCHGDGHTGVSPNVCDFLVRIRAIDDDERGVGADPLWVIYGEPSGIEVERKQMLG
ncbi:MAG: hypothetical protein ACR2OO_00610 [Thermomicrobiales bacterium]